MSEKKRPLSFYDGSTIGDIVGSIENNQHYGLKDYENCAKLAEWLLRKEKQKEPVFRPVMNALNLLFLRHRNSPIKESVSFQATLFMAW